MLVFTGLAIGYITLIICFRVLNNFFLTVGVKKKKRSCALKQLHSKNHSMHGKLHRSKHGVMSYDGMLSERCQIPKWNLRMSYFPNSYKLLA